MNHLAPFTLLGVEPGTCKECAVEHSASEPHNKQSLHYQYYFFNKEGRWPTWNDAMAHCSDEVKEVWKEALTNRGE